MSCADSTSVYRELIAIAAECRVAADFGKVLKRLTEYAGAEGCIVWEKFYAGDRERRYFRLADYFPKEAGRRWYFLSENSEVGRAIEEGEFRFVPDVPKAVAEGTVLRGDLLADAGVQGFCATPVTFGERREAAVNLYWAAGQVPSPERLEAIRECSIVIPALNHSVLNQMGFDLLQLVERALNEQSDETPGDATLRKVAEGIHSAFNAKELAIYLEDRLERPNLFDLKAIVWPWETFQPYTTYERKITGVTTWAIVHNRTIRFVDLNKFEEERDAFASEAERENDAALAAAFRQLTWPTRDAFMSAAKKTGPEPPPSSFLCVPISYRGRVVGAIRCNCTAGPTYLFDGRHANVLELVAEKVGNWWGNRVALMEEKRETQRFRDLVQGIADMHQISARELSQQDDHKMTPLLNRALALLGQVSPWRDALSIRMVRGENLEFVAYSGTRWSSGGPRKLQEKLATTYDRDDMQWAGSRAIRSRKVVMDTDPGKPGHLKSRLFPDARRLLHGPILWADQEMGVIDVRGFDEREFPPHLELMVELIGRQLGLHAHLQDLFSNLRESKRLLARQRDEQNQIYEDFVHQLRNPLVKAGMLGELMDPTRLQELVTHLRHAMMFADTINNFVSLTKAQKPEVQWKLMTADEIIPQMRSMARDQELVSQHRKLRFEVDEPSFERLRALVVYYAPDLFLHCAFNLLDNASKYSKQGSDVQIRARYDESARKFIVSVTNQVGSNGHRIEARDRARLVERGQRGDRALRTTAGGRGIGLWIVSKFMDAMNGELLVQPTDAKDRNLFGLVFRTGVPKGVLS